MTDDDILDEDLPEEISEEDEDDGRSGGSHRVPEAIWLEIESAYELGQKRMEQLAKEHGVSRQSISRRFHKRGIKWGVRQHEIKTAASAAAAAAVVKKVSEFAERRAEMVEETRMEGYKTLRIAAQLATKTVSDAKTAGRSFASIHDELKSIRDYQRIVIESVETRLGRILNADAVIDETTLPTLVLDDITEKEIEAIQRNVDSNEDEIVDVDAALGALV